MKKNRIYLVGHGSTIRLVRAAHRAQALAHVARSTINVAVASQDEIVEAMTRGIKVEAAADAETPELFEEAGHAPATE